MNEALRSLKEAEIRRDVSGWTVEQSTMVFEERSMLEDRMEEVVWSRAWSSPTQMKMMDAD